MGTPRKHNRLEPATLKKLNPGLHADGDGLYLNVEPAPSGSRSWLLRVSIRGKRRWLGLGSLTLVSLAEARVEAVNLRARARKGEDVLAERRLQKHVERIEQSIPTFEKAAAIVDASQNAAYWLQPVKTYVIPVLGHKRVDAIDSSDVLKALAPIWTTVPHTARRALRRTHIIFDWCQTQHYRDVIVNGIRIPRAHPCDGIKNALPKRKLETTPHASLPYADLPEFIQKLRASPSTTLAVKLALEFLILTCSRPIEVLGARWEEIDFEKQEWVVPAERMKPRKEHRVPLSSRSIEILDLAKEFNDSKIIFPGRYQGHGLSDMAFLMSLSRMGYEEITAHGFRATFKTWAEEETDFKRWAIEASMSHAVKGIEWHYLRTTFFPERRKLMDAWMRFATSTPQAKVVGMR